MPACFFTCKNCERFSSVASKLKSEYATMFQPPWKQQPKEQMTDANPSGAFNDDDEVCLVSITINLPAA